MPEEKKSTTRDISMSLDEVLPESSRNRGTNYLLAIGIDEYKEGIPPLYNAVKDAEDVVNVLLDKFQFEKENIITLYNQDATKQKIYSAARSFVKKVTPEDSFLVYFSGHGVFDKDFGLGYWIPVDAKKDGVGNYIPNSEIRQVFSAIKSRHTFLMIDSCFSGSLFAAGSSRNVSRREKDPSRWGLTAGRNEVVSDGQPGENSPFATSLLYQLENADRPIGVAELCDKVLEVVSSSANQTPRGEPLKIDGHKGGQFFFHLKKDEKTDWKIASATNSIAAYQSFITRYPAGINTVLAQNNIKALKAEAHWQKIELSRDTTLKEVEYKLSLANQYVADYEDQPHYDEALNIGELLEYKKDFLHAESSEFALRRFVKRRTPNVAGASAIKKLAQEKLGEGNKEVKEKPVSIEVRPKKKIAKKPSAITSSKERRPKVASPLKSRPIVSSSSEPSFFEKNKKYVIGALLLVPLLLYGIHFATSSGSTVVPTEDPQAIALSKAKENFNTYLRKGDAELKNSTPNYQTAKTHYQDAINAANGFSVDTKSAENGVKKCDDEMAKQNAAAQDKQREYDRLIMDGNRYYDKGDYNNAIAKYQAAKGKVTNDNTARRGITNCQNKLNDLEKKRQANLKKIDEQNANSGTFTDSRDGQIYKWVRLKDGKKWMAQNLNYNAANSWCYGDNSGYCPEYGRLYYWEAAKEACPSGWHLPSNTEVKNLIQVYGGEYSAYKSLFVGGNSGFATLLGGFRVSNGKFHNLRMFGFYWSLAENSSVSAWNYNFNSASRKVSQGNSAKRNAFSCRCLKD